jgi:hypothetical protein
MYDLNYVPTQSTSAGAKGTHAPGVLSIDGVLLLFMRLLYQHHTAVQLCCA